MKIRSKAYLSRSEVARLFHVAPITVARWAAQGKLPSELTLGGQRRYPRDGTMAVLNDVVRRAPQPGPGSRARTIARPGRGAGRAGR
jgi:hypothetical protein